MIFGAAANSSAVHHGPVPAMAKAGNKAEIALRFADGFYDARSAHMRHERHRKAEMETRGIAHQRIAGGKIGMDGERRLHIGEGRNDDPPNALGGIERQVAVMALDQPAHHLGFARWPKSGAGFFGLLDRDQVVDDLAALDQELVHLFVDAVDFLPQIGERFGCVWRGGFGMDKPANGPD